MLDALTAGGQDLSSFVAAHRGLTLLLVLAGCTLPPAAIALLAAAQCGLARLRR